MFWTPKVLEVQERARGPLSPCQVEFFKKNVEFSCLPFCLIVKLLNVRVCAPDFAMKLNK